MHIRLMIQSDIPVLAAWVAATPLWQRYALTAPKTRALLEEGQQRGDILLVAEAPQAPGEACGLAWCVPRGMFGRSAYLRLLGVSPHHTGTGLGAALLAHAEQSVVRSSREMFLLVSDFNVDAQRFYQRHGYVQAGAIPGYVLPDVTELLYWKRLS
jgi:ribosomal protein S18 acetylase RimI-like enzyme